MTEYKVISQESKSDDEADPFEEAGAPKRGLRQDIFEDIVFPNLIDFTDHGKRKKYFPDTVITSDDGFKIYYHRNKLVDIEFFDKLYNGNMEEAKSGNVNLEYDAIVIILMLNFIDSKQNFIQGFFHGDTSLGYGDVLYDLTMMSNYIQFKELEELCYKRWEINGIINLRMIKLFTSQNRKLDTLMSKTVSGTKTIEDDVPTAFLSNCFDFGMNSGCANSVILNIIPYYNPTDKQMSLFKLDLSNQYIASDIITSQNQRNIKLRQLQFIANGDILRTFLDKYKNTTDNPGVIKMLHLLATFMIS